MNIYWSQKDIPALKGLTLQAQTAAKKAVIGKVWRHWQVWLPFVLQAVAYILFLVFVPQFPYRFFVVVLAVLFTVKLAALPFNHYLQHYLSQDDHKS